MFSGCYQKMMASHLFKKLASLLQHLYERNVARVQTKQ